jgi:U3 small nucleolar RNA-associated protein 6
MAGATEFRNEQFIKQYEHIKKLELLNDEELTSVKRKRSSFEMSIKNSPELKNYLDYIKYEIALMRRLKQRDSSDKHGYNAQALDKSVAYHIKDLFRMALKKFQANRKLWEHYLAFSKQKFSNFVTPIYREMLTYHHESEDYIEAARYEMSKNNHTVASNLLIQAMGRLKEPSNELVIVYIECSLNQGLDEDQDDEAKEAAKLQATKFFDKFLKTSEDVTIVKSLCDLLKRVQHFTYAMDFQNYVLKHLTETYTDRADVWDLVATRHFAGLITEEDSSEETKETEETEKTEKIPRKIPLEERLLSSINVYEEALELVAEAEKPVMFEFYINKMLELDMDSTFSDWCLKVVRRALGSAMHKGLEERNLSETHFICFLKLRMLNMDKDPAVVEAMIETGALLYPKSMELNELAIKYFLKVKNYEALSRHFQRAIQHNERESIELYSFLCGIFVNDPNEKDKAKSAMLDAINSSNKQVSEKFQPYYIEYLALTENIQSAREAFTTLTKTKTINSLSLKFFDVMIKLEDEELEPDTKTICRLFEQAAEHFGSDNPQVT